MWNLAHEFENLNISTIHVDWKLANVQKFIKIGQTCIVVLDLQDGGCQPLRFLDFQIFGVGYNVVGRANMHHRNNFYQNRLNGCGDIALNIFLNGGRPPYWILKNLNF